MTNDELRKAVENVKSGYAKEFKDGTLFDKNLEVLIDLASQYLEMGGVSVEDWQNFLTEMVHLGTCIYDKDDHENREMAEAIAQQVKLWIMKKLEGIEEIIEKAYQEWSEPEFSDEITIEKHIAANIRNHLTGRGD